MNEHNVEFVFRDEDFDALLAVLQDADATDIQEIPQEAFLPVAVAVVVGAAMGLSALANVLVRLLRIWKCGVVIDARGSRLRTEKNCELPRGSVLVLTSAGTTHTLYEPTEQAIAALIKTTT